MKREGRLVCGRPFFRFVNRHCGDPEHSFDFPRAVSSIPKDMNVIYRQSEHTLVTHIEAYEAKDQCLQSQTVAVEIDEGRRAEEPDIRDRCP